MAFIFTNTADGQPLPAAASREDQTYDIETVTVTAEKRPENEQDVAASMQAFKGEELNAKGIDYIEQLSTLVPSLQFTTNAGYPIVFIRGLGSDNLSPSADASVATYIDGIYTPMGSSEFNSLAGVTSIEILKGPQGTLFGRDSTGGAININTREPGAETVVFAEAEAGNFSRRAFQGEASGPVTSWLSAGASMVYSHEHSPFEDRYFATQADSLAGYRLKLRLDFNPIVLSLTAYHGDERGTANQIAENTKPSLLGLLSGVTPQLDSFHAFDDHPSFQRTTQSLAYGRLSWLSRGLDIHLLASYQRLHTPQSSIDFDASPLPLAAISTTNAFNNLQTAELQFVSNDRSWLAPRLSWVGGLYYLQSRTGADPEDLQIAPGSIAAIGTLSNQAALADLTGGLQNLVDQLGLRNSPAGSGGLTLALPGILGTRSLAAYAQTTYEALPWLGISLGGRLQHEDRFLTKSETDVVDVLGSGTTAVLKNPTPSASADNFSPHAAFEFRPLPLWLLYASYSVAYKSGTFDLVNILTQPSYIQPERAAAFELGAKLESPEKTLRFNGALFDTQVKHLQSGFVSLLSAGTVEFISVPAAHSRGAEIETTWLPLPVRNPLVLSVAAAYVDATYTNYAHGPGFLSGSGLYSGDLDLSGHRIVYTPRWSGIVSATQGFRVPKGMIEFGADEYFNSGFFSDANNTDHEGAYALTAARVTYGHNPWGFEASLFCNNLLDRRYHQITAVTDFGTVKALGAPREFGIRLAWSD